MSTDGFASFTFPDDELAVILATEGCQVLLVIRERQTLDQHLVHLEAMLELESVEVPDNNVSLRKQNKN